MTPTTDNTKLEIEEQAAGKLEAAALQSEKPTHSKALIFGGDEADDQSASYECCRWC